jgi:hypothetical protein
VDAATVAGAVAADAAVCAVVATAAAVCAVDAATAAFIVTAAVAACAADATTVGCATASARLATGRSPDNRPAKLGVESSFTITSPKGVWQRVLVLAALWVGAAAGETPE